MNARQIENQTRRFLKDVKSTYKWKTPIIQEVRDTVHIEICSNTRILKELETFSSIKYQKKYTLPTEFLDIDTIKGVTFDGKRIWTSNRRSEDFINSSQRVAKISTPNEYFLSDDWLSIEMNPPPESAADTTTLNGAISSATATSITLTSTVNLEEQGAGIVGTEVIHWDAKTSTTIVGCTRGAEGTTAATHSTAATFTKRDIGVNYIQYPDDLASSDDVPFNERGIFKAHHISICYGIAWRILEGVRGREQDAEKYRLLYEAEQEKMRLKFTDIKDRIKSHKPHPDILPFASIRRRQNQSRIRR